MRGTRGKQGRARGGKLPEPNKAATKGSLGRSEQPLPSPERLCLSPFDHEPTSLPRATLSSLAEQTLAVALDFFKPADSHRQQLNAFPHLLSSIRPSSSTLLGRRPPAQECSSTSHFSPVSSLPLHQSPPSINMSSAPVVRTAVVRSNLSPVSTATQQPLRLQPPSPATKETSPSASLPATGRRL